MNVHRGIVVFAIAASASAHADDARFRVLDGYIDRTGKLVIKLETFWSRDFVDGRACVDPSSGGGQQIIDPNGKLVYTAPNLDCGNSGPNLAFADGQSIVLLDDKVAIVSRDGKLGAKVTWKGKPGEESLGFSDGLAAVRVGSKWGYVSPDGTFQIPPQFPAADSFSEGRAAVQIGSQWKFIDKTGKPVSETAFAADPKVEYHSGLLPVEVDGKPSWLARDGSVKFTPCCQKRGDMFFEGAQAMEESNGGWNFESIDAVRITSFPPSVIDVYGLSENLAGVQVRRADDGRERWGFADRTGKIVIDPIFTAVSPFVNGLAHVQTDDDKSIYIDHDGAEVWSSKRSPAGFDFGFYIEQNATYVAWTSPPPLRMRRALPCDVGVPMGDRVTFDGGKLRRGDKVIEGDFAKQVMDALPKGAVASTGFWDGRVLTVYSLVPTRGNEYRVQRADWVDGKADKISPQIFTLTVTPETRGPTRVDHAAAVDENKEGMAKYNDHDYRTAAARFRHAIVADPKFVLARYNLASVASILGDAPTVAAQLAALAAMKGDAAAKSAVAKGASDPDLDRASTDSEVRRLLGAPGLDTLADKDVVLERNGVWTREDACESHVLTVKFGKDGKVAVHEIGGCTGDKIDAKRTSAWKADGAKLRVDDPALRGEVTFVPCGGAARGCLKIGDSILHRGVAAGP